MLASPRAFLAIASNRPHRKRSYKPARRLRPAQYRAAPAQRRHGGYRSVRRREASSCPCPDRARSFCRPYGTAQQKRGPPGVAEAMAPRGRPPAEHVFDADEGGWVHKDTRHPFDAEEHAARVHAKKVACLRAIYWERGGRQKRLARYVRKRASKPSQQKLDGPFARAAPSPSPQPGGGGETSASAEPAPPSFMPAAPQEGRACTSPPSPPPSGQERNISL